MSSSISNVSALTGDGEADILDLSEWSSSSAPVSMDEFRGGSQTQIRRHSWDRFLVVTKATDARETCLRAPKRSISTKVVHSLGISTTSLLAEREGTKDSKKKKNQRKRSASPPRMPMRKDSFIQ
eukprot:CAMPEP_0113637602 /NCGR_PEP_ID=MMETSP0017_2-20120614/19688_1 /TAXON_ID=2856 /ORGANISM="Cylindrotheca closterium" /LENGTH=124 /DNA_ID=CAMNT_0000548649 /DNA_START=191 /DNA_END=565 /DNA_ORIENTATION=+ /assembly_acc=CAM_ASM_000147